MSGRSSPAASRSAVDLPHPRARPPPAARPRRRAGPARAPRPRCRNWRPTPSRTSTSAVTHADPGAGRPAADNRDGCDQHDRQGGQGGGLPEVLRGERPHPYGEGVEAERAQQQHDREFLEDVGDHQHQCDPDPGADLWQVHPGQHPSWGRTQAQRRVRGRGTETGQARVDALVAEGEEANQVGVEDPGHRAGGEQPGASGRPERLQPVVQACGHHQHPDPENDAGNGVADCRQRGREAHQRTRSHPPSVHHHQRDRRAARRRHHGQQQAVPQVLGEAGGAAGAATRVADRPGRQPQHRETDGGGQDRGAGAGGREGPAAAQRHGRQSVAGAAVAIEPGAAAQSPLRGEHEQREQQHDGRESGRGLPVEGALPHLVDAHRDGLHVEVLHRGEVGQGLHQNQRESRGECRSGQRRDDPPSGPGVPGTERAGRLVAGRRLLGQRGAGEQVDVGVEAQRQHDDGAAERAGLGEPGGGAEQRPPRGLHRADVVNDGQEREAQDVGGHRQREHQQPGEQPPPREAVRGHQPGQPAAEEQRPGGHAGHQSERAAEHAQHRPGPQGVPCVRDPQQPVSADAEHRQQRQRRGADDRQSPCAPFPGAAQP